MKMNFKYNINKVEINNSYLIIKVGIAQIKL